MWEKPLVIFDFATDPFWIYMGKIWFSFLSVYTYELQEIRIF